MTKLAPAPKISWSPQSLHEFTRKFNKISYKITTIFILQQKPDKLCSMTSLSAQISSVILALFGMENIQDLAANMSSHNHYLLADKTHNLHKLDKNVILKKA